MKKLIAMILALVSVLSLCACGANTTEKPNTSVEENVPETTQPETTQPEELQIPNLDMFVGKWNICPDETDDKVLTFTINADGTLERNGDTLIYSVYGPYTDSDYEMMLSVESRPNPDYSGPISSDALWAFNLYLTRTPENTYVATLSHSLVGSDGVQYYRESDYRVVELTDENAMEYLEQAEPEYTYKTDGDRSHRITRQEQIRFKAGIGAPSGCEGKMVQEISLVEIYLGGEEGYTEGDVLRTYTDSSISYFEVTVESPYVYDNSASWYGEPGSEVLERAQEIMHQKLVGVKGVSGYVFIPV